jgi:hypothetical protein
MTLRPHNTSLIRVSLSARFVAVGPLQLGSLSLLRRHWVLAYRSHEQGLWTARNHLRCLRYLCCRMLRKFTARLLNNRVYGILPPSRPRGPVQAFFRPGRRSPLVALPDHGHPSNICQFAALLTVLSVASVCQFVVVNVPCEILPRYDTF